MQESNRIRKVVNYTKQKEALEIARFNEKDFTRESPSGTRHCHTGSRCAFAIRWNFSFIISTPLWSD